MSEKKLKDFVVVRLISATETCVGVIGKRGLKIKQIRTESGAKILIDTRFSDAPRSTIEISGKKENVKKAVMLIIDRFDEIVVQKRTEENKFAKKISINFLVTYQQAGAIIGNSGYNVKRIRSETDVYVNFQKVALPRCDEKIATLRGDTENLKKAAEIVLQNYFEFYNPEFLRDIIYFRPEFELDELMPRERYSPEPYLPHEGFDRQIQVKTPFYIDNRGHLDERFEPQIRNISPRNQPYPSETVKYETFCCAKRKLIPYPPNEKVSVVYPISEGLIGTLIGHKGYNVSRIRDERGVRIDVDKKALRNHRVPVTISGSKIQVREALMDIQCRLYGG